jgi:cysteinyl-tRNA synthetase
MLTTHYRQPIDWTVAGLNEAERVLQDWSVITGGASKGDVPQAVTEALADDLNTPKLLAALHELRKSGEAGALRESLSFLGIELLAMERVELSETEIGDIEDLIAKRNAARARKDWKEADRIRAELVERGVQLKDNKDGTTSWEVSLTARTGPGFSPHATSDGVTGSGEATR